MFLTSRTRGEKKKEAIKLKQFSLVFPRKLLRDDEEEEEEEEKNPKILHFVFSDTRK